MKKLNKLLALCLALTMLLLCVPFTASAAESEYGPEDLRSIHGIDYNRITQKATGDSKSYPVELKMGDLTFNGELTGSHGLSYEELNKIINDVLKEKKLTVEQIQLVKALSENVGDKATEFWGAQVLEGLISYLPLPEGLPKWTEYVGGVSDVFAIMVDGKLPTAGEYAEGRAKDLVAKAAEKAIETGFEKSKEYIKKVPWAAAKRIPLLGQMINTVKVGIEWQSNDKFDAYLKALEQKMADVNDFYSECSRRANKLAEEKGAGSYVIKFDKEKNYRTYNATFWGVSGVMISAELSGVLEKVGSSDGIAGEYKGTLWLDVSGVDMTTFANTFCNNHHLITTYRGPAGYSVSGGSGSASLEAKWQGDFSVYVTEGVVEKQATVFGGLELSEDPQFHLKMQYNGSKGGLAWATMSFTSDNINSVSWHTENGATFGDYGGENTGDTDTTDIGTIWKPMESEPIIIISYR